MMKIRYYSRLPLAAAAVLFSAVALAAPDPAEAPADVPPPGNTAAPSEQQQAQVSDEKLRQFATAAADVQKVQQDYAEKAQSLQKNAEERIISSVEGAGMTVEEFTALVARVQSDPDLARRLDDLQGQ